MLYKSLKDEVLRKQAFNKKASIDLPRLKELVKDCRLWGDANGLEMDIKHALDEMWEILNSVRDPFDKEDN